MKGVGSRIGLPDQPFLWHLWTRSLLPGLLLHWAACQHRSFLVLLPGREAWIVDSATACALRLAKLATCLENSLWKGNSQDAQGLNGCLMSLADGNNSGDTGWFGLLVDL